jgi:long-subunit acyl-CoA synthetase (AMP-forming)
MRVTDTLDRTAATYADRPALRVKRNGQWHATTWREYRDQVRLAARGFMALGLQPGQCITILGYNCPEWFMADLGAIAAGAIPAGIYTTNTAEQCKYIAAHCEARIAVVENAEQLAKFRAVRHELPSLRAIVQMHGESSDADVLSWAQLLERGQEISEAQLDARIAAQTIDDVCTLIYTSGTTGAPKAVMLTHDNITWTAAPLVKIVGLQPGDDAISYLPLSHIAEQITGLHGPIISGACTWFAESIEKLGDGLREVHPHYFVAPPRVWEKIQEKMEAAGAQAPAIRKRIVRWARRVGLAGGYAEQRGERKPLLYPLADRLVFSKVRERLGLDRAKILVTSTAPIARSTLEFFLSLGLPICEVYGMSECTGPATLSLPSRYRTGKAGFVLPGTEMHTADDGEVCMRGRHVFKGYYKDPVATAEALDADGWLHSGDIGEIDGDGFLQITDRKKEIIITAGGENIAPQLIEGYLKSIHVVSQAVVVGDRRRYLSVLLTLDPEKIPTIASLNGSPARDPATAAECEMFNSYLQREIDAVNQRLARVQTVKRFAVIPGELTIEGGELTPTMKVRRKVVLEKYAGMIERLYRDDGRRTTDDRR